ncbi:MAG: rhodanese-like domain-containing protein [Bacteroidetes bacterium]|nr:rhodanese-like domain-containing protein [Fibrella sp.]
MRNESYVDISLAELEAIRRQPGALVVDVRDAWEFDEFNIGGLNIPLGDIRARKTELLGADPLLVICTNGVRSRIAAKDILRQPELRDKAVFHLKGGIIEVEE